MQTDQILKEFWEDNERFADFFNTVFFQGEEIIRPEELETISPELSNAEEKLGHIRTGAKYRDKVKKWKGTKLAILGIENQSSVHYAMPERVMLYDALQYNEQIKRSRVMHKRRKDLKEPKEYLSRYAKNERLAPVLTVVIYYGEEPWDGPKSLREMTDLPQELEGAFNDYRMHLFQILGNRGEDFKNGDIRAVLRNADALRSGRLENMDEEMDRELVKYLAAFVNAEEVFKYYEAEEGDVNMCTMLRKMISDGEARGEARAVIEILEEQGAVSEKLRKQILEERNLDVLRRWLKQAFHSESVGEFQKMMYRM